MAIRSTVRDIAEAVGVSLATVSLALNGKPGVSEETRRRVLEAATRLGYQQRGLGRIIGLIIERLPVPAYNDPAVGLMIHGIEVEAGRRGYHMLLASIEPDSMRLPAMIEERQVAGLIALGGGDMSDAYIRLLLRSDLPVVVADNYLNDVAVSCVLGDNAGGGYRATRHLIDRGHRRIAILEGPRKYKTLTERIEGYLRALDESDILFDPALMIKPIHDSRPKGYRETEQLLALPRAQRPTAIFAVSDKTALGALAALMAAGLSVPEDMALVGFDDIAESALSTPALTTVHVPLEMMGQVAVGQLIDMLEGSTNAPHKTVLFTDLIVRASSGDSGREQVSAESGVVALG